MKKENTVINVDLERVVLKNALKIRAKENGRTMKTEAKHIIQQVLLDSGEYKWP